MILPFLRKDGWQKCIEMNDDVNYSYPTHIEMYSNTNMRLSDLSFDPKVINKELIYSRVIFELRRSNDGLLYYMEV